MCKFDAYCESFISACAYIGQIDFCLCVSFVKSYTFFSYSFPLCNVFGRIGRNWFNDVDIEFLKLLLQQQQQQQQKNDI
jgi:hypothetical protein